MKLLRLILFLFILLCFQRAGAQTDSSYFTREMFKPKIEELRKQYGFGKLIPAEYELPVLVALSHYPELNGVCIDFICLPIKTTMMAQPHTRTLFHGKPNRTYVVFFNTSKKNTGFIPSELSFNQLVGVIGHELGHISYYTGRTAGSILIDAAGYYFRDYKKSFEKGTDIIAIHHGLGWQLLDFTDFVQHKATLSKQYARKKKITYMNTEEMRGILLKQKN